MSLILVIGNKDNITGFSDGRVSDRDASGNLIVLRENQCKIKKLSDQTIVLFSGILSQCATLIEHLETFSKVHATPEYYSQILMQTRIVQGEASKNVNVRLIVAGIDNEGHREWWSHKIDSAGDQCQHTYMTEEIQYLALGDIESDEDNYIGRILCQAPAVNQQTIRACFIEAAERHKSINTVLFQQSV